MPQDVITLADQFKRALEARDTKAIGRLVTSYRGVYASVQDMTDALILEISAADETMTPAQIRKMERYGRLMSVIQKELGKYAAFTGIEIGTAAREAIRTGEANARVLTAVALGSAQVSGRLNTLNPAVIERLLGFLSPEGNLYKRLEMLPGYVADKVSQVILDGVAMGKNPRVIARAITDTFGMGLTESMRMMRTSQIYAYREANRASYVANSDVVKGWIWDADLAQACACCVAMHGTEHPLDETLDDHHNGHCAMLPLVVGAKNDVESGLAWFDKQSAEYQRQVLGKGKYEAWQGGKFSLSDIVGRRSDDVYGNMRYEKPLKDLIGVK